MRSWISDPAEIRTRLEDQARAEGFSALGICAPDANPQLPERLAAYLADDRHGQMEWMAERTAWRAAPDALWPEARSVIMLAELYTPEHDPVEILTHPDRGAVSVYAQGKDYHDIVKKRLKRLGGWLVNLTGCEIKGFDQENATPKYRDVHQALASRDYDAFVMTEMVRLSDAIKYHQTRDYAAKWAAEAAQADPDIQIFLYESWHALDDKPDWLTRLPEDLETMWKPDLLWPAARAARRPVWLIPVGQVMARLVAEAETHGGIAELKTREDLFATTPDGKLDTIHPNDLGIYLVALTHYAVLYGKSPVGLPNQLMRADGSPATAPSPELARRMQEIVWEVVTAIPETGVPAAGL